MDKRSNRLNDSETYKCSHKTEQSGTKVLGNAIQNFTDPFTVEASKLVSLASGATMPPDIEKDVQRAESAGKEEKDLFIQDRLVEKKKSFFNSHTPVKAQDNGSNMQKG